MKDERARAKVAAEEIEISDLDRHVAKALIMTGRIMRDWEWMEQEIARALAVERLFARRKAEWRKDMAR